MTRQMQPASRQRIFEVIALYPGELKFNMEDDLVLYLEPRDIEKSEIIYPLVSEMEQSLRERGVTERNVFSARDVVLEMSSNLLLHGKHSDDAPEILLVTEKKQSVSIWLCGCARKQQVDRIWRALDRIYEVASPPKHRETLFDYRNAELFRTLSSPSKKKGGGGLGLATIAALSRTKIRWLRRALGDQYSFMLHSTI